MKTTELLHRGAGRISAAQTGRTEESERFCLSGQSIAYPTDRDPRMERDKLQLLKDNSGTMFVYVLIILAFLFTFSLLVSEYYRVHSIQTHLEYEMQRAVNIAVEEAMRDSWRQDKIGKLDTVRATQDLYEYLNLWLGLNGALEKYQDGTLMYSISLDELTATEDPPRLHVRGNIFIPSQYPLFGTTVEVPFSISSKNTRID